MIWNFEVRIIDTTNTDDKIVQQAVSLKRVKSMEKTVDRNTLLEVADDLINRRQYALRKFRSLVGDLNLVKLFEQSKDYELIGLVYLSKHFINDIYKNLATDSFFELPSNPNSWATAFLTNASMDFGKYLIEALKPDKSIPNTGIHPDKSYGHFNHAIGTYYLLLSEINIKSADADNIEKILFGSFDDE
jgi:hypothetical protein